MPLEDVPTGWVVWHEEPTKLVLAYRPDVFDSDAYPAPCLPTIYATKGKRDRRPGRNVPDPDDPWYVTLYLEPDVARDTDAYDSREAAATGIRELARAFHAGELDYRTLYQVPREAYLDRLDEVTGSHETAAGNDRGGMSGPGD